MLTHNQDPTGPKDTGCEIVQEAGAVAEEFIAASPNCMGPPIQACAEYLHMEKCGKYGRNNLTVWKSPLFPRVDGQEGRKGFLDNQLTAIVWILSRFLGRLPQLRVKSQDTWNPKKQCYIHAEETPEEKANREKLRGPKYFGGILADSMGLGKTLTTIALLDLLSSQKLNVTVEDGKPKYYPMLILVPNATVATQWIDEIEQIGSHRGLKEIIVSGSGLEKTAYQERVRVLTSKEFNNWPDSLKYVWDNNNRYAASVVVVMSIDTWSQRTCVEVKTEDEHDKEKSDTEWKSTFTEKGRKFSVVVVDEAYKVRHAATRLWKSVALLKRQFTLLVTATPCMNVLSDLLGLARILWQTPEKYLKEQPDGWSKIETFTRLEDLKILDTLPLWDDSQLVAGRPAVLTKLIQKTTWKGSRAISIEQTRKYLKYFEALAILRRAPSSTLYADWERTDPVSLEGLLPNVGNLTVDIQADDALQRLYQDIHIDIFTEYMETLKQCWSKKNMGNVVTRPITSLLRQFQIVAASVDIFRLEKLFALNGFGGTAPEVEKMRKSRISFMHIAPFLLEPNDPEPTVALDYVKLAVRKSPILRYILHHIKENTLNRNSKGKITKLLITEASPIIAYYYELVLQFLLIHCRTLHAGLSAEERRDLVANFNEDTDNSCHVLIQMYTVGFAGSNLHRNCSQVIVASQAHSLAVQWQAVHRVIRVSVHYPACVSTSI